jgi:hypothetical protein
MLFDSVAASLTTSAKRKEMGKRFILGLSAVENEIQQLQSSLSPTIAYMAGG